MQLSRGGTVSIVNIPNGQKAVVTGGTQVGSTYTVAQQGAAGNQWQVVSINPSTGTITPINTINPYGTAVPAVARPVTASPAALAPARAVTTPVSVSPTVSATPVSVSPTVSATSVTRARQLFQPL